MKHLPLQYSARGIITDRDGRILLVKHASHKPWTLPGGHVEENETFQEAFIREVREELDIVVELVGLVTIYKENNIESLPAPVRVQTIEYTNEKGPQRKYEEFFLAHMVSGTITVQASEIASFAWQTLDQIQAMPDTDIYSSIRDIILSTSV
jgi:ADP-ribose pyrophosphatase YjhB (NUDIX family)